MKVLLHVALGLLGNVYHGIVSVQGQPVYNSRDMTMNTILTHLYPILVYKCVFTVWCYLMMTGFIPLCQCIQNIFVKWLAYFDMFA